MRIAKKAEESFYDEQDNERVFSVKDYTGVVTEAYFDDDENPVYDIELDAVSMRRLPGEFIEATGRYFNRLEFIPEVSLVKEKPNRESPGEVRHTYRELFYYHLFADLPADQQERLLSILLARPGESDESNWLACFEERLSLPFEARTRGILHGLAPNRKVKVTNYLGYLEEEGILVMAKMGNRKIPVPLFAIAGADQGPVAQVLDDYLVWYDLMMVG